MTGGLNTGGYLFMILVWTGIMTLIVFCFRHIFREKPERMVAPGEVEEELDRLHK